VDLVFTDPIYSNIEDYAWLAETAARVLKPSKSVLCYIAHHREAEVMCAMFPFLRQAPVLQDQIYSRTPGRLFSHSLQCNLMPVIWFSKGLPDNKWMFIQVSNQLQGKRYHKWGKNVAAIKYRILKFTDEKQIIFDPFCGGGSIPEMAHTLNRKYLAFEIDPQIADLARQRVANTQPPLPLVYPEQLTIEI
jgi:DNA modification methylase